MYVAITLCNSCSVTTPIQVRFVKLFIEGVVALLRVSPKIEEMRNRGDIPKAGVPSFGSPSLAILHMEINPLRG
jgi:hypothetical protein